MFSVSHLNRLFLPIKKNVLIYIMDITIQRFFQKSRGILAKEQIRKEIRKKDDQIKTTF